MRAANAATLVVTLMKVVTEVGAPWYTSGVQVWKGAALTLKAKPTNIRPTPMRKSESVPWTASSDARMPVRVVWPVSP